VVQFGSMIERIEHQDQLLALIIRRNYEKDGIEFFTPDEFSQQLAYMNRPEGYEIAPHVHNIVSRQVKYTQEVLVIKSGEVRVDFYDDDKVYLKSRVLVGGDVILLAQGGHGFKMIKKTEMIEIKQGPYVGDRDKVRFNAVADVEVKHT
jgi:mannose-6-phosphate isomerase-like protein (cupin superfamily)